MFNPQLEFGSEILQDDGTKTIMDLRTVKIKRIDPKNIIDKDPTIFLDGTFKDLLEHDIFTAFDPDGNIVTDEETGATEFVATSNPSRDECGLLFVSVTPYIVPKE